MTHFARPGRLRCNGLLVFAVWAISGCGGDDLARRYPVSGRVTRQGQPLTKGTINFLPLDASKGRTATAEIQPDGSYSLMTKDPGDGAIAGEYRVTVNVMDVDDSKLERMPGGMPRLDQPGKVQVKSMVPSKFSDPSQTELKATVETHSNTCDFDLKG
jgi:hypothetical protein